MADEATVNATADSGLPAPDGGAPKSYAQELKDSVIALAAQQKAADGGKPQAEASTQAPVPQADTPQARQEFAVSAETRDKAKQLGYSDKEIDKMSEADAKAVETASKRYSRAVSKLGREKQELAKELAMLRDSQPGATVAGDTTTAPPRDFRFDAETYGVEAAEMLNSMSTTIADLQSKVQAIEGASRGMADAYKAKEAREFDSAADAFIAGLNQKVYAETFGTGAVEPDSSEADERAALKEEALVLREMHQRLYGVELPVGEALEKALAARYPEAIRRETKETLYREIEERSKGRSAPPTGRPNIAHPQGPQSEAERMANVAAEGRRIGIW